MQTLGTMFFPFLDPCRNRISVHVIYLGNGFDRYALAAQQKTMGTHTSAVFSIMFHRTFQECTLVLGQGTHISHAHSPRNWLYISHCFGVIEGGIIPKNFWSGTYGLANDAASPSVSVSID